MDSKTPASFSLSPLLSSLLVSLVVLSTAFLFALSIDGFIARASLTSSSSPELAVICTGFSDRDESDLPAGDLPMNPKQLYVRSNTHRTSRSNHIELLLVIGYGLIVDAYPGKYSRMTDASIAIFC